MPRADDYDVIEIRGLRVLCIVGVLPEEREREQPLEIDVELFGDLRAAGRSDDLNDTVNYGHVAEAVAALCVRAEALLLERLAYLIAVDVAALDGAAGARVTVRKLRPPVPTDVAFTAVQVTRWAE